MYENQIRSSKKNTMLQSESNMFVIFFFFRSAEQTMVQQEDRSD